MKYSNIILLSDMDGTLLDSNSKVSGETLQALQTFTSAGGRFGVATGRSQSNALPFLEGIDLNAPSILYNGGALYDFSADKFLFIHELQHENLTEFLRDTGAGFPDIMIQIYSPEGCSVVTSRETADPMIISGHWPCAFGRMEDMAEMPWIKVLFYGQPERLRALEKELEKSGLGRDIRWVFSAEIYLELLPLHASKGSMISQIRNLYRGCTIYAAGDYYNDREMLEAADVGIAPANALPCIKEIADRISAGNDESAVADIILHIME